MRIYSILFLAAFALQPLLSFGQEHRMPGARRADPTGNGYYVRHNEKNQGRRYEWTKPDMGSTSLCIEVDSETNGERHRLLVEDGHCPKVETVLEWSAPQDGHHSRCYRVDTATMGLRFRRLEDVSKCPRPQVAMVWHKAENDAKQSCYEVDTETRGKLYRRAALPRLCPRSVDPYVAFGRYEPLKARVPYVEKNSGRMPASLAPASDEPLEERDPKEFWEDPEDMIRHVPDRSRKGQY